MVKISTSVAQILVPILGPFFGSHFWDRPNQFCFSGPKNGNQKMDPKLGPRIYILGPPEIEKCSAKIGFGAMLDCAVRARCIVQRSSESSSNSSQGYSPPENRGRIWCLFWEPKAERKYSTTSILRPETVSRGNYWGWIGIFMFVAFKPSFWMKLGGIKPNSMFV